MVGSSTPIVIGMGLPYRNPPMFVVGDLVYFLGHQTLRDTDECGIIIDIHHTVGLPEPLYKVFWLNRGYDGVYSGGQLLLVYEIDPSNKNITFNAR